MNRLAEKRRQLWWAGREGLHGPSSGSVPACQTFVKRTAPNKPISSHHDRPAKPPNPLHLRAFRSTTPYHPNTPNLAHNPKVAGSNPAPAINKTPLRRGFIRAGSETSGGRVPTRYQTITRSGLKRASAAPGAGRGPIAVRHPSCDDRAAAFAQVTNSRRR